MVQLACKAFFILLYRITTLGLSKGAHVTRYYMYRHLARFSAPRDPGQKVLSISHSEDLARRMGFTDDQITEASYPECNIFNLSFGDGEFDAVVSDQVLEHIEGDPAKAFEETFRVLKPGGLAVHTTCFVQPIHGCPNDYWRFTADGLKLLGSRHGTLVDVGGWGNPLVWVYCMFGIRYQAIPHTRLHPAHWIATYNAATWPIVTWVLVRKHEAAPTGSAASAGEPGNTAS